MTDSTVGGRRAAPGAEWRRMTTITGDGRMSDLREALEAAQVAALEHHCPSCAIEALTGESVDEVIADVAHGVIHSGGHRKPSRREAASLGFSYGVLTGRALALRDRREAS